MQNYFDPNELGVKNYWWDDSEYFWMEVTDRDKSEEISQERGYIGDNIWAPTHETNGTTRKWSYSLVALVKPQDLVFHYSKTKGGIIGYSKVKTYAYEDKGIWGANDGSAGKPFLRNIFKADLHEYTEFENILTMEEIRTKEKHIFETINELKKEHNGSIYQPFVIKNNRVELPQAYFVKIPKKILSILDLIDQSEIKSPTSNFVRKKPQTKRRGKRKRRVNAERNKIVELYAMKIATNYLENNGWEVEDTSKGTFDLTCHKDGNTIYVEVKGRQSVLGQVELTKNEVIGHRANQESNALMIVSDIRLDADQKPSGGILHVRFNWYPENKDLLPTQYIYYVYEDDFESFSV